MLKPGSDDEPQSLRFADVSADGTSAIVDTQIDLISGDASLSPYMVLDLESGETVPVPDPDLEVPWSTIAGDPKFIGDGTEIVFEVAYENSLERGIVVSTAETYALIGSVNEQFGYGLNVNDDGTILLLGTDGHVLVLSTELSVEEDEGTPQPPCSCTPPEGN